MNHAVYTPQSIQRTYFLLLLFNTLAGSFIWGINTIFLLDAGLNNAEAFSANAFFTAGQVIFEIPTGIIADTYGRRVSYLLGAFTWMIATVFYVILWQQHGAFWLWALASLLLGLGFTFFSGAVEAWLVDALHESGYKGPLDSIFAKGQVVTGIAMLSGSVAGGIIAQVTNLGVPYIIRSILLGVTCVLAYVLMHDIGFTPTRSKRPLNDMKKLFKTSLDHGIRNKHMTWLMLASPFSWGVMGYVFYALQPYALQLYGDEKAYGIAGIIAAAIAGAQIIGGVASPWIRKQFKKRTSALLFGVIINVILLSLIALTGNFYLVIFFTLLWGLIFAAVTPIRQAYLNAMIPSAQRATVLSFDNLIGSSGGVVTQPILGKTADVWNYPASFFVSAFIQNLAIPFLIMAKRNASSADTILNDKTSKKK